VTSDRDREPPQWAVDYWVDLCKKAPLESVVHDMRRFVEDEMYVERSIAELARDDRYGIDGAYGPPGGGLDERPAV
jgi:hypothetical protein